VISRLLAHTILPVKHLFLHLESAGLTQQKIEEIEARTLDPQYFCLTGQRKREFPNFWRHWIVPDALFTFELDGSELNQWHSSPEVLEFDAPGLDRLIATVKYLVAQLPGGFNLKISWLGGEDGPSVTISPDSFVELVRANEIRSFTRYDVRPNL
jgi:hypothetical protein